MAELGRTTIRKGGKTTTIVRRSASDGGTYSYTTTKGDSTKRDFKGGSNDSKKRSSTKRSEGIVDSSSQPTQTASATVKQNLNATSQTTPEQPQATATPIQSQSQFNAHTGSYDANAYYEVSYSNGGGVTISGEELNKQEQNPFLNRIKKTDPNVVASGLDGQPITRSQAKAQAQKANRIVAGEKGFFTVAGQKEAVSRVGDQFKVIGQRTANLFLPKDKEYKLNYENASFLDRVTTNPVAIATAPLVVATATSSIPIAAAVIKAGIKGTAGGFAVVYGIEKGSDYVYSDELEFKRNNPELAETVRQYARQDTREDAGPIMRFLGLDVTGGGRSSFVQAGTEYLESTGISGEQLKSAQRYLKLQAKTEQVSEVSYLIGAELSGEFTGGTSVVGSTARTAIKLSIPDKAILSTTIKKIANKPSVILKSPKVQRSMLGGFGEGTSAMTSIQYVESREVDPITTIKGGVFGAVTAGVVEGVRVSSSTTPKGKALTTTVSNVIEPQEFIVDKGLDIYEKIKTKVTRPNRVDLTKDFDIVRTGVNKFDVKSKPKTGGSKSSNQRITTVTPSDSFQFQGVVQQTNPVKSDSLTDSIVKVETNTNTPVKNNQQFYQSTNTDTLVKTQTKTTTQSLSQSQSQTRVFSPTPDFAPILPFGFGGGGRGRKSRSTGKQRQTYTPSAFAVLTNLRGKASKGGSRTGLGLRPIIDKPKKRKGLRF